jgi:hypothetical protein
MEQLFAGWARSRFAQGSPEVTIAAAPPILGHERHRQELRVKLNASRRSSRPGGGDGTAPDGTRKWLPR